MLFVAFVIWRIAAAVMGSHRRTEAILREIAPVTEALERGAEPSASDLARFAEQPRTRNLLLEALQEKGRESLFPEAYASAEAIAESDLVFWLCHPNELQQAPDETEFIGRFARELGRSGRRGCYYLFRYRVKEPHWAAADGWMAGVAGPYLEGEAPSPAAPGTFSDFAAFDARTPDEHVEAVHRIMEAKGVYEDL